MTTYASLQDAAAATGGTYAVISAVCKGKAIASGKHNGERLTWRFLEDARKMSPEEIASVVREAQTRMKPYKKVQCLTTGVCYQSAAEASQATGVSVGMVRSCCQRPGTLSIDMHGNRLAWAYCS